MTTHVDTNIDNLLFEWICALACNNQPTSALQAIFPVFIGSWDNDKSGDLFKSGIVDRLSKVRPTATVV